MDRCPALCGEWHYRRRLYARENLQDLVHALCRSVHKHVFLVVSNENRLYAEKEFVQDSQLLFRHILIANEQRLTVHHHLHLTELIAYECRARAYDVEDTVRESDAWSNLHRALDGMDMNVKIVLLSERTENVWVGGSDLLSVEPLHTSVFYALWYGERNATFRESEPLYDVCIFVSLHELIFSHDTDVSHSACHALRNVIVSVIEHFKREIA